MQDFPFVLEKETAQDLHFSTTIYRFQTVGLVFGVVSFFGVYVCVCEIWHFPLAMLSVKTWGKEKQTDICANVES